MIKKIISICLIFIMAFSILFPVSLQADNDRTLQDLIDELNEKRDELRVINEEQALTEAQIAEIRANIAKINRDLQVIDQTIASLIEEIRVLNIEIKEKDEEIKRVINQHQLTNGNNAYVEYVMGAATVTDFIFRVAIVEQMSEYNQNLIDEMNQMIADAEQKNIELEEEKQQARVKRGALYDEQFKLGQELKDLGEHEQTIEDEINDAIKTIDNYKKYFGCQPQDRLKDCTSLPLDASFVRPMGQGVVTSNFGMRTLWGRPNFHYGIDIGGNSVGTNVYPVANGRVVFRGYNLCMEHYIIIQHHVNGEYYASRYIHLNSVAVQVGNEVMRDTVIGGVGGANPNNDPRICSTGPHLHFEIAEGIYGEDFSSFRGSASINPREKVNLPPRGTWYYGRF